MKNFNFFLMLLLFWGSRVALAQVTFRNPTYPAGTGLASDFTVNNKKVDNNTDPIIIPATGSNSLYYTATLYRPVNTSTGGYVEVYLGTSQSALASAPLTTTSTRLRVDNTLWSPAIDPSGNSSSTYQQVYLTGTLTVSAAIVGANTGFYAVYYDNQSGTASKGEVTHPVVFAVATVPTASITDFIPCSGQEICGDQCVPYNTVPQLIRGRVLAHNGDPDFERYLKFVSANNMPSWAEGSEREGVDWQYSYDRVNWTSTGYSNTRNFQPPACTRLTYYRRHSRHYEHCGSYFWDCSGIEDWYDSNIVTITPGAATPAPTQAAYTICGASSFTIAVAAAANATSYNWYSSDPAWDINGQGRSVANISGTSVRLTSPAGVPNGTYEIRVSANSTCAPKSPDAIINVTVTSGSPPAAPTGARWVRASPNACIAVFNLSMAVVPGATSYRATSNAGGSVIGVVSADGTTVTFNLGETGPASGLTATVTAYGSCGASSYTTAPTNLAGPPAKCGQMRQQQTVDALYPNPATDQVVIATEGQAAEVTFFDATGTPRKISRLRAEAEQTAINVLELPAGVYHVRIMVAGQSPINKQLIIQH
jgi:hypothetical protein